MKIIELMTDIRNLDLVLPEFQREYVWTSEQAKQLIVSLFRDYPTGSLLFGRQLHRQTLKTLFCLRTRLVLQKLFWMGSNASPPCTY